jgi:pyruvate kinase
MGRFPVEAVQMLASIAANTEPYADRRSAQQSLWIAQDQDFSKPGDLIALSLAIMVEKFPPAAVFTPTKSGTEARRIARNRLPVWITAVTPHPEVCQQLQFTYGVHPEHEEKYPANWTAYTRSWMRAHGIAEDLVLLAEGPSEKNPQANHKIEVINLRGEA